VSDGDGGIRLNRRRLLAAVSTVGVAGALTGRGAAAYLTDSETLADNRVSAGSVTLALDGAARRAGIEFTLDDYGFEHRDEARLCLGLGDESNPAWVWIRACPAAPVVDALDARLTVDAATVYTGSLGGLLERLAGPDGGGVLLTEVAGAGDPVTPGADGAVCLTVAVWAPTALADDPDTVRALKAASPFGITVDAYAEQSRHVPTPRRPVAGANPSFVFPACEEPTGERGGYAISNVSLCTASPVDPAAVTWSVRDPDTDADVTGRVAEGFAVTVTSPVPIRDAVVKAGPTFRRFDAGGATTITVSSTGGTPLDVPANVASCACDGEGVKLDDWNETTGTFDDVVALSCAERGGSEDGGGPPGQSGDGPPGQSGDGPPGQSGDGPPGQSGDGPPGQSGDGPPGQSGDGPPGESGDSPPGQHGPVDDETNGGAEIPGSGGNGPPDGDDT